MEEFIAKKEMLKGFIIENQLFVDTRGNNRSLTMRYNVLEQNSLYVVKSNHIEVLSVNCLDKAIEKFNELG